MTEVKHSDGSQTGGLRCIVGARVSVFTGPQKVSQLAQIETGARWVAQNGGVVVGTFEDLGVSASVSPFDRPDLGPWLTDPERLAQWDALVFSKMDRAFRSTRHCVDVARWAEEAGKLIVFAEDGLTLDYRGSETVDSMLAELFVYIGSFFAQLELNRFQTRAKDMHRVIRQTDRWATGKPPLGYRIVPHPSGKGKGLEKDPETQKILHEMADWILAGGSFTGLAAWLLETYPGVKKWTARVVIDALTSPRTQGFKVHSKGTEIVVDDLGDPVRLADPTFDNDTWSRIQQIAQERSLTRKRTNSDNPMLGVGFCGICGKSLAQQISRYTLSDGTEREYRRYRCSRTPHNCKGQSYDPEILEALIEEQFLEEYGDQQVTTREWQQGNDLAADLAMVEQQIKRLRSEEKAGLIVTDEDHEEYLTRMKVRIDRRTSIMAEEPKSPGWVYKATGKTFRQVWDELPGPENAIARRDLLVERGVRLDVFSPLPFSWEITVPPS